MGHSLGIQTLHGPDRGAGVPELSVVVVLDHQPAVCHDTEFLHRLDPACLPATA